MTRRNAAAALSRALSESEGEFQASVIQLAELCGWRAYHVANVKGRLRAYTSPGFPDLVLARDCVLFRECKDNRRGLDPEQIAWRDILIASGADWALWRPRDWPEIERTLTRRKCASRVPGCYTQSTNHGRHALESA